MKPEMRCVILFVYTDVFLKKNFLLNYTHLQEMIFRISRFSYKQIVYNLDLVIIRQSINRIIIII